MKRKPEHDEEIDEIPDNPGPEQDRPVRPPPQEEEEPPPSRLDEARFRWVEAINYWQIANQEVFAKRYSNAEAFYEESQKAVVRYFEKYYTESPFAIAFAIDPKAPVAQNLGKVLLKLWEKKAQFVVLWSKVQRRWRINTLEELNKHDWLSFYGPETPDGSTIQKTAWNVLTNDDLSFGDTKDKRQESLDYFALILACVFVPLARAEMNRTRRNYDAAIDEYKRLLDPIQVQRSPSKLDRIWLTCAFIERPFILSALGETLIELGDLQFKEASQGDAGKAKATYQSILDHFKEHGAYVELIAKASLTLDVKSKALTAPATDDEGMSPAEREMATRVFGKDVTIEGIKSRTNELPGLSLTKAPAESWLDFHRYGNGAPIGETNPRIYSLLLNTQARLLQIEHGFNYLGYKDDYVPPWRFQLLLERARYFAEHAKTAQRDFMNFLHNAEQEEFQEQGAAQAVEMEKANVAVETARVSQASGEVAVARGSMELAQAQAWTARDRFNRYRQVDQYLRDLEFDALETSQTKSMFGAFFSVASGGVAGVAGYVNSVLDLTGTSERDVQMRTSQQNRSMELFNLGAAIPETLKAKKIADDQLEVARRGLVVAGLQRQASLLRHEFAIQNLQYLRNRTLNSEQWFRLASAIRGVADTYLRYAIELAFLAEQAYEFEADKRINVIRFDYDQSELGAFLAADFLLTDLDTVEQDFITNQKERHQQVRYVVSMARDFHDALGDLRRDKKANFVLRLEQLEKRFPGLYNARIGVVDVLPIALMDSTRFSLDLTHTGSGQMRIKGKPDVPLGSVEPSKSVLNVNDLPGYKLSDHSEEGNELPNITLPAFDYNWSETPKEMWPVKFLVTEPQTAIYSGLARQDAASAFPVAATSQRNAFEGLGLAGGWSIDMSGRDNQMVPESLADILITFTISGYHDIGLRAAVQEATVPTNRVTAHLSARRSFPDAFYEFNRSGRMTWKVTREMLTAAENLGPLCNVAVLALPGPVGSNYLGRVMCHRKVRFRVSNAGIEFLGENPRIAYVFPNESNPLEVTVRVELHQELPVKTAVSWDFGDGSPRQYGKVESGPDVQKKAYAIHDYKKPGRYNVTMRIERDRRFTEFRAEVVVSRTHHELRPPVEAFPKLEFETGSGTLPLVKCTVADPLAESLNVSWKLGEEVVRDERSHNFTLSPGEYTLGFTAIRALKALVSGSERSFAAEPVDFDGLTLVTNRRFDVLGTEVPGGGENPPRNKFTSFVFGETNSSHELSPANEWTVEFPIANNEFLKSVSSSNVDQHGWGEIADAVLVLEYETTPG